jgi:hypothetical protein
MNVTDTLKATLHYQQAGFTADQAQALASQQEVTAQELVRHIGDALEPKFAQLEPKFARIDARFSEMRAEMHSIARDQTRAFTMIVFALAASFLAIFGVTISVLINVLR